MTTSNEAPMVRVPAGYALIAESVLHAWGKLDEVRAACVFPIAIAQQVPADGGRPSVAELTHMLGVNDPAFNKWREAMPDKHWATLDLSAVRLGYELGKAVVSQPVVDCTHKWVTDGIGPTQCVRCGITADEQLAMNRQPQQGAVTEQRTPRNFGGKTKPLALCPASCGCLWVNNGDGSMSLFSVNSKSCDECETLPWDQLLPVCFGQQAVDDAATMQHGRDASRLIYGFMLDYNAVGLAGAAENLHRGIKSLTADAGKGEAL